MRTRSSTTSRASIPKTSASSRPDPVRPFLVSVGGEGRSPILALAILILCLPATAAAQGVRLSGTVLRVAGGGPTPLAGAWVVLHRIARGGAGPLDSVRTDRTGAYRFTVRPDTGAQLVVAARHAGVAYVSEPVVPRVGPVSVPPLAVYDTTSGEPVLVLQRQILVQAALPDGSRPVVELLVLRNPGGRTIVGADSLTPTWEARVALGAVDVVVGQGDLEHEAVHAHGDTLEVLAPLPPGQREVVVTYLLPAARLIRLPVDRAVADLGVMVADTTATATGVPLRSLGISSFEGARYLRLQGTDVADGTEVVLRLAAAPLRAADFWWLVVLAAAGTMAGTLARWRRRGPGAMEGQAARIAVLDRARANDPAWPGERRRLVATLAATLANRARAS